MNLTEGKDRRTGDRSLYHSARWVKIPVPVTLMMKNITNIKGKYEIY